MHIQDSVMAFRTYKAYFFPSCIFYNKNSVSAQIFAGKNASCLRKSLKTQRMNGSFTALSPRKAKLRLAWDKKYKLWHYKNINDKGYTFSKWNEHYLYQTIHDYVI